MEQSFRIFLDRFMKAWESSSLNEIQEILSIDYQAREIASNEIVDFGYEESIQGWEQGFKFVKENHAQWRLSELGTICLRNNEVMAVLTAMIVIDGKPLATSNLFFDTFKKSADGEWKLVRSYIETGVPNNNLDGLPFK
ncbi:hypothetical protein [Bacillus timonensis]|uniref:hypothetical protein n=1 Tax=Bacillus timonensis TaxID=1033734 RepID=UPI00028961D2|nr:hypothetical protein [Bacillus timonensis]